MLESRQTKAFRLRQRILPLFTTASLFLGFLAAKAQIQYHFKDPWLYGRFAEAPRCGYGRRMTGEAISSV
jgi:hypothetical protein